MVRRSFEKLQWISPSKQDIHNNQIETPTVNKSTEEEWPESTSPSTRSDTSTTTDDDERESSLSTASTTSPVGRIMPSPQLSWQEDASLPPPLSTTFEQMLLQVSTKLSDSIFLYPLTTTTTYKSDTAFSKNIYGVVPKVLSLTTRVGAGSIVAGASAVTTSAACTVFATSQSLPSMLPTLHQLHHTSSVWHISTEFVNPKTLSVERISQNSILKSVCTITGNVSVLYSQSHTEALDMAIIAHALANTYDSMPVIHIYDGSAIKRSLTSKFDFKAAFESLEKCDDNDIIQSIMTQLYQKGVLKTHYSPFTYEGSTSDENVPSVVIVTAGATSSVVAEAASRVNLYNKAHNNILMTDVGVLHVNQIRPWASAEFVKSIPRGVEKLIVLDDCDSILAKDVRASSLNSTSILFSKNSNSVSQLCRVIKAGLAWTETAQNYELSDDSITEEVQEFGSFQKRFVFYTNTNSDIWKKSIENVLSLLLLDDGNYAMTTSSTINLKERTEKYDLILSQKSSKLSAALADIVFVSNATLLNSKIISQVACGGVLVVLNSEDPTATKDVVDEIKTRGIQVYNSNTVDIAFFKLSKVIPFDLALAALKRFQSETLANHNITPCLLISSEEPNSSSEEEEYYKDVPEIVLKAAARVDTATNITLANGSGKLVKPHEAAWKLLFPESYESHVGSKRLGAAAVIPVTKYQRLTPLDYSRNVFHIEMDISNTSLTYEIGEALAVYGVNSSSKVVKFQKYYYNNRTIESSELYYSVPNKEEGYKTMSTFQILSQVLDIFGRPSRKFYEELLTVAIACDSKVATDLISHLLSPLGKEEYKNRVDECLTFADLLVEFKSCFTIPMTDLIRIIPKIKARHYSIASSRKMNPNSVHLLVVVHDWVTPSGKHCVGQCSQYLANLRPGDKVAVSVCSSVMKLPTDIKDPIIMAGLGTGMAPFRAFLQEKAFLKRSGLPVGPIALYFGSRYKAKEFLYGEELEMYEAEGILTYLRCAFSRDQEHKIYIQDRIRDDKEVLKELLVNSNGHFYMCGPTWPVSDVRSALELAFEGLSSEDISAKFEEMKENGRYVLEVY